MADNWSKLTALRSLKYLGTHPRVSGQVPKLDVIFTRAGIIFEIQKEGLGSIKWSSVSNLAADNREGLERRVTGPRVLLLGALAWVAKKETVLSYLIIEDEEGMWVFEVPKLSQIELKSGLTQLQKYVSAKPQIGEADVNSGQPTGVAERLDSLRALLDGGHISEAEHDALRQDVLRSV